MGTPSLPSVQHPPGKKMVFLIASSNFPLLKFVAVCFSSSCCAGPSRVWLPSSLQPPVRELRAAIDQALQSPHCLDLVQVVGVFHVQGAGLQLQPHQCWGERRKPHPPKQGRVQFACCMAHSICQPAGPSLPFLHRSYSGLSAPCSQCCMESYHPQWHVLYLFPWGAAMSSSLLRWPCMAVLTSLPRHCILRLRVLSSQHAACYQDWDKCPKLWMVEMRHTTLFPLASYVPSMHDICGPAPPPKEKDREIFCSIMLLFLQEMLDGVFS